MAVTRTASVQNKFLSINGSNIPVKNIEGGDIFADVITEQTPGSAFAQKRLGRVQYKSYKIETGSFTDELKKIINQTWEGNGLVTDGEVVTTDLNFKVQQRENFIDAALIETIIPECDGSSKDSARIKLCMQPSSIRIIKGDRNSSASASGVIHTLIWLWVCDECH